MIVNGENCEFVVINGIEYRTIREISEAYGIGYYALQKRLLHMPAEQAVAKAPTAYRKNAQHGDTVEIDGVTYSSVLDAATQLGLKPSTVYRRLARRGRDGEDVSNAFSRKYERKKREAICEVVDGVEYHSITELSKLWGCSPNAAWERVAAKRNKK